MTWFRKDPLRNTTGRIHSGNLVTSGQYTAHMPRPGCFNAHTKTAASLLRARVEGDGVLRVEEAESYVASCQARVNREKPVSTAQVNGRRKSFFSAANRRLGACLGIGMGPVQVAKPAWVRPDREAPSTRELSVDLQPTEDAAVDGTQLREAVQGAARINGAIEHVRGVHELLNKGLEVAQERFKAALDEVDRCMGAEKVAFYSLVAAEGLCQEAEQDCLKIETELLQATDELAQYQAQAPGTTAESSSLSFRAGRLLEAYEMRCQQSSAALEFAQSHLHQLREKGGRDVECSAVQEMVQELQGELDKFQALRDRAQVQVNRLNTPIATSAQPAGSSPSQARAPSPTDRLQQALSRRVDLLTQLHQHYKGSLVDARVSLDEAQKLESLAKRDLGRADAMLENFDQQIDDLKKQIAALAPLGEELVSHRQQAVDKEATQQEAFAKDQGHKTEELLKQPPGFKPGPGYPALSGVLGNLRQRLPSSEDATSVAARWPLSDTLEVVCAALAKVTNQDALVAANTLHELMHSNLTDLVPLPGQWLDGTPRTVGMPQPKPTKLEKLVEAVLELPCGAELLTRLVQTQNDPAAAIQRDAVSVYYRAMGALASPQTTDSDSCMWLHSAAFAACHVAHPESSEAALSTQQRAAFHGVRNGFVSVAKGSPYDQANLQLQRFSDNSLHDLNSRNPFRTRRQAAAVATQVGLSTPLRQANDEIQKICTQLQQSISARLVDAHKEAHQRGQTADLRAIEPLVQASSLLHYIQTKANKRLLKDLPLGQRAWRYLRLDSITIDQRAWQSIDKHTALRMKTEGTVAPAPKELQDQVERLSLATPDPAAPLPTQHSPEMLDLETCLSELRSTKSCAVLQVLQAIHSQIGVTVNALGVSSGEEVPPEKQAPASIPEDEALQVAEDDRQERTVQLARDMGFIKVQQSLNKASLLEPKVDAFMGTKSQWKPEEISHWLTPVVGTNSSAVTLKHGRTSGLNASGLSVAVSRVGQTLGIGSVARLDAERVKIEQQVFRYAKQSRGFEAIIGDSQQRQRRLGFAGGAGWSFAALPTEDGFAAGGLAAWSRGGSETEIQGVVLRAPVFGEQRKSEAKKVFSDTLESVVNWRDLRDEVTGESYSSPMQAVLSRNPDASVGTLEQYRVVGTSTRSGVSASVAFGGPIAKGFVPRFFGSMSLGAGLVSERRSDSTVYKTRGGTQGFDGRTEDATAVLSAQLQYNGHLGGTTETQGQNATALRARSSSAMLQLDLHRKQAQSSTTVVRQPDGTLVGEKALEFNTFEPFEMAVRQRWDEWIYHGVQRGDWRDDVSQTTKSLLVEKELESFLEAAKKSIRQAGTVSLSATLEVRPAVSAELSACLALEELALSQGQPEKAQVAFQRRQRLLEAEASYVPYKLKAIVRSQIEKNSKGVNLAIQLQGRKTASSSHEYDSFPKM